MNPTRLASLVLLAVATSCQDTVGPEHTTSDLDAARQLWQAQNLHTYAFTLQRSCFCANTHRLFVVVLADTVAGVLDLDAQTYIDLHLGQTVDDLFAFIQTAIARPAQLIHAEYDPVKGFPTAIDYDGAALIADDELSFRVSDVHPISPQTGGP